MKTTQLCSFVGAQLARRFLFVHSESTPNPNSKKFIPEENGTALSFFNSNTPPSTAFEWKRIRTLPNDEIKLIYNSSGITPSNRLSNLAKVLLQQNEIERIFIGTNFITATKTSLSLEDWAQLSPKVTEIIDEYFATSNFTEDDTNLELEKNKTNLEQTEIKANENPSNSKEPKPNEQAEYDNQKNKNEAISDDTEITEMVKELLDTKIRPFVQNDGGDIAFVNYSNGIVKVKLHGACTSCASSSETLKRGVASMIKYYIPEILDVVDVTEEDSAIEAFEEFEKELHKRSKK